MPAAIRVDLGNLKRGSFREYAIRFVLGGLITVAAGLIAKWRGPSLAGLFLAFPAILPAAATLIAKHEEQKKAAKGLHGEKRARYAAALDTYGAAMGSVALMGFAGVMVWLLERSIAAAFVVATVAWVGIALTMWALRRSRHAMRVRRVYAGPGQARK